MGFGQINDQQAGQQGYYTNKGTEDKTLFQSQEALPCPKKGI